MSTDLLITDFGARAESGFINTAAIQAAIDQATEQGGGRVVIPSGAFETGSIQLKDNVELHLAAGARLLGSITAEDYPVRHIDTRAFGPRGGAPEPLFGLVMAIEVNNVALTGRGEIFGKGGQGEAFRAYPLTDDGTEWHKPPRPKGILFYYCRKVLVEGVTVRAPQEWGQVYVGCDFVTVRGTRVFAHDNANGDGIDIDGCQDLTMTDCVVDADDNALIFKGRAARDCINCTVQNSIFASKITAIKTGTESAGGFKNITITNCIIRSSYEEKHFDTFRQQMNGSGIALETTDGGDLDGIVISNIVMEECYAPFFIKLGDRGRLYEDGVNKPKPGVLRNVIIQNIICKKTQNSYSSTITGLPEHPIENLTLSDIIIEHEGGIAAHEVQNHMPENSDHHPWPGMFGRNANYPAYGLYIRHVRGLHMRNVRTVLNQPDERPALHLEDVTDAVLRDMTFATAGAQPSIVQVDCTEVRGDL